MLAGGCAAGRLAASYPRQQDWAGTSKQDLNGREQVLEPRLAALAMSGRLQPHLPLYRGQWPVEREHSKTLKVHTVDFTQFTAMSMPVNNGNMLRAKQCRHSKVLHRGNNHQCTCMGRQASVY